MADSREWRLAGSAGDLVARTWPAIADPEYVALISHGYGEHVGRYERLAQDLVDDGATVYAVDHLGHGKSDGERVAVHDFEDVVDDLHLVAVRARAAHPNLPLVLIGHSMGGLIAARYAQRYTETLTLLILSSPVLGRWQAVTDLLALEAIPDAPLDSSTLSRDPAVGARYDSDALVWHGPFKRVTLLAIQRMLATIASGQALGGLPLVWIHGDADELVPADGTFLGIEKLRGRTLMRHVYRGARHELFNETNAGEVTRDVLGDIRRVLS